MVKQTASKVPQIRFKGFEGEWHKKLIGSVCRLENGFAFESKVFCDKSTGVVVLTPGSVRIGGGFQDGKGHSYKSNIEIPIKYKFEPGEIFITMTDLTPTAQALGYPAKVPDDGVTYLHNQRLGRLVDFKGDSDFLFQQLSTESYHRIIVSTASGTTVKHSSPQKVLGVECGFPIVAEQTKIGEYFRELDSLIVLHQRKHDKLVALKKAMLQKMFPQPGETTPEIRFKGFSGAWIEKTLGDIIDLGGGRDYKHLSPGDIPVYGTGGYMLSVSESLSSSRDAVGIGRKGTIDKPYILKAPFWTVDTLFYAIPKAENHLDFVYCIFQRIDWKQKDESTGVPSLSKVAINGVAVLSTNPTEQKKIGIYFRTLDEMISKHATQLQKLQQIKSACLEKMFV